MTVEFTKDPTVDENSAILTISYCVLIVTIMRPDSMSQVQGRPVSAKEEEFISVELENRLVRRTLFHFVAAVSMAAASLVSAVQAGTITFGSDDNQFQMEFVTIGNPGNAPDTDSNARPISATLGKVDYIYGIGKFEVSEDMIDKYNTLNPGNEIIKYTRGPNKPATSVSWNEAARFVNWLNTSTGNQAAYKIADGIGVSEDIQLWQSGDAGYDPSNPYRNRLAKYVLPNFNEWYKAAYHSPSGSYFAFPIGSNNEPANVSSGSEANTAVFSTLIDDGDGFVPPGPADVDQAGGLSCYGVMGLGGNVFEWEENSFDLANSSGSSSRRIRGGYWGSYSSDLSSAAGLGPYLPPSFDDYTIGFRVASVTPSSSPPVPEPSMMVIGTLFGLGGLAAKRRMKR